MQAQPERLRREPSPAQPVLYPKVQVRQARAQVRQEQSRQEPGQLPEALRALSEPFLSVRARLSPEVRPRLWASARRQRT